MKTLVVYYSRSGNTRKIAEEITNALECDIEEINDKQDRSGALGYMRSVINAIRKTPADLEDIKHDPSDYDLVILGTPIWNRTISTPLRTYLTQNLEKFNNVALFYTAGGKDFEEPIKETKNLIGSSQIVFLSIRAKEIEDGSYKPKLEEFIKNIT
jgi:flavodoxin